MTVQNLYIGYCLKAEKSSQQKSSGQLSVVTGGLKARIEAKILGDTHSKIIDCNHSYRQTLLPLKVNIDNCFSQTQYFVTLLQIIHLLVNLVQDCKGFEFR